MAMYLHLFDTESNYEDARENNYNEPWASLTEETDKVNYNKTEREKEKEILLKTPFTIEALGSGNITWALGNKTVQYSKNEGSWTTMNSATTISVASGDTVQFKGTNTSYDYLPISSTAQFNAKGNIMSLLYGDDFIGEDSLEDMGIYTFGGLFRNNGNIINAKDLMLPATTLMDYCYQGMFRECTSLTTAPELPATTLVYFCYEYMFGGCTSLTTAPELPATTLAYWCYGSMFGGCTSLTTAPALPATTLANYCYNGMFYGCTSLTTAPELPATTLAERCYNLMFSFCSSLNYIKCLATNISAANCTYFWVNGVSSSGTFVKNPSMSSWSRDAYGIPEGWTVVNA